MFTDADYRKYFTTLLDNEKETVDHLDNLISTLSDAEVLDALTQVREHKADHLALMEELLGLLDEVPVLV